MSPDVITGSTIIEEQIAQLDEHDTDGWNALQEKIEELEADVEGDPLFGLPPREGEEYLENVPDVYGIAFPKTMLPSLPEGRGGVMHGTWSADEIKDLEGGTDEVFVRVWLYGPQGPIDGPTGPGKKD